MLEYIEQAANEMQLLPGMMRDRLTFSAAIHIGTLPDLSTVNENHLLPGMMGSKRTSRP